MLFAACTKKAEVQLPVVPCAPMPEGRASAAACVLNGKAYVFGGRDQSGKAHNDLWEYNPETNIWTKVAVCPGKQRVRAVAIGYNNALYLGLGFTNTNLFKDSCYLRDWWRYSPQTNTWDSLAEYIQGTTVSPIPYVVGERLYTIYGSNGGFSRTMIYYAPSNNTWTKEEDSSLRAKSGLGGCGAQVQGRCFYGLGFNTSNLDQWYEVDLPTDKWTKRTFLSEKGRSLCACCGTDEYVYIFGGRCFRGELTGGEVFNEYYRYNVADDKWEFCGSMPCGRAENQIAFTLNGKAYFGLGEDPEGKIINQLYRIE